MHRLPRYHVQLVRESSLALDAYPKFLNSRQVFDIFRPEFAASDREEFHLLTVDTRNRMIGVHHISTGGLSTSIVHPREVFKPAILDSAAAIILLHNHPSGDPSPSGEDSHCTQRIWEGGRLLGIRVLDHIIIGETEHFSFADAGQLPK